jgi:hypothetical protein
LGGVRRNSMTSQSMRYQTQWAAQFYVAAELTRRGYQVALTLGNAPQTDLLVSTPGDNVQFRIDVKGQSTHNFWLVQKREVQDDLYFVLVYLPKKVNDPPRFFVLSCVQMMKERADYQKHIEEIDGKYRDDMGGMNWSTAFEYEDRWDALPGSQAIPRQDIIRIPPIPLKWSDWVPWASLAIDARREGGVSVPSKPGVYEVKRRDAEIRLTIGKASNLRRRVKQGLVKGSLPHSTGERMREENVDFADVVVRWAVTDHPSAAEEELHDRHQRDHGQLPLYTKQT